MNTQIYASHTISAYNIYAVQINIQTHHRAAGPIQFHGVHIQAQGLHKASLLLLLLFLTCPL